MKDILIVLSPTMVADASHCNTIETELTKRGMPVKRLLDRVFLATGPTSFEIAMLCARIASENKLPFAIFEIESVLIAPPSDQK